jgi:hypothetical protein
MTTHPDEPISMDVLEQSWTTLADRLSTSRQAAAFSLQTDLYLKNLRRNISSFEQYTKQLIFRKKVYLEAHSKAELVQEWNHFIQHSAFNAAIKPRKLVGQILSYYIHDLVKDKVFIQYIQDNPSSFYSKKGLRDFYFLIFQHLYRQENDDLLNQWAKVLAQYFQGLKEAGSLNRIGSLLPRYQKISETIEVCASVEKGFLLKDFEHYLKSLLDCAEDRERKDLNLLEQYYRRALGFDSLPEGIRLYCQQHLFSVYLFEYKTDTDNLVTLNKLLDPFCQMNGLNGRDNFLKMIEEAYGGSSSLKKLPVLLKECIKKFLLRTIGDPRLHNAEWNSLKSYHRPVYDALRYWFVEADFDLFFDFAFRHSPDIHRRKELWIQFLKQAHDFRVFLPTSSYKQFQKNLTDQTRNAQVYENADPITGFVMCLENLIIYEAVESGNAAYVYDMSELALLNLNEAKQVIRFVKNLFEENKKPTIGSKKGLAHTCLAPVPGDWNQDERRSRRFTHDQYKNWHEQVLHYLKSEHYILPDNSG